MKFFLILIGTIFFSVVAYLAKALTLSGAILALIVGILIGLGGGMYGYGLVGLFFISSMWWSYYKEERKYHLYHLHEKGAKRDSIQIICNGGIPALCCLGYGISHEEVFLVATAVSLASATADTWASEIGVLSSHPPRSILNFKPLDKGLSGGVSVIGTLASIAGACLIASFSATWLTVFSLSSQTWGTLFLSVCLLGILGSILDSYLGSLIQPKYECVECHLITERRLHHDQPTNLVGGWSLMNNDWVNLLSQFIVTLLAFLLMK
ncbi:DUF92 domain-containing protein [Turicibacter sanguinis]|nr:DUF92 domain-containing protein [Turicibacter sanguinis]